MAGEELYRNTKLYCDRRARQLGSLCREAGHDTAVPARGTRPRHGRLRAATRRWAPKTLPAGACDTAPLRPRYCHVRASGRACARLGVLAGPAGCALSVLSLF